MDAAQSANQLFYLERRCGFWLTVPIFVILWYLLFNFSRAYLIIPGISFSFLPAGATFFFVYRYGWPALPLGILGPMFNSSMEQIPEGLFWHHFHLDVRHVICIGGSGLVLRYLTKGAAPMRNLSSSLQFSGIAFLGGLLSGVWALAVISPADLLKDGGSILAGFAIGDTNGILFLAPLGFFVFKSSAVRGSSSKLLRIFGLAIACTWIAISVPYIFGQPVSLWYPIFVPVLLSGLRHGTGGTLLTLLIVSASTIILVQLFGLSGSVLDLQIFMLSLAVVGYLFAGVGNELFQTHTLLQLHDANLQQEVNIRTQELKEMNQELIDKQERIILQEKMASLGTLTAGVAHELRNPFNFINGFTDVCLDEIEDAQRPDSPDIDWPWLMGTLHENLGLIQKHSRHATAIVDNMMEISKKKTLVPEVTDINSLIKEHCQLVIPAVQLRLGFTVNVEQYLDPELKPTYISRFNLSRIIINLLNNAIEAMKDRAQVAKDESYTPVLQIKTLLREDLAEIIIKDNGTGIASENLPRVWDHFYTSRPPDLGNVGMGLSIAYNLAKEIAGEIFIESKEGEFTMLRITLPVSNTPMDSSRWQG